MNNKGADQTAWMHRLICAFVVCIWHTTHFLMARLMYIWKWWVDDGYMSSMLLETVSLKNSTVNHIVCWCFRWNILFQLARNARIYIELPRVQRRLYQPGNLPSRIRVFAIRMKSAQVRSYSLSAQQRLIRLGGCPGQSESSLGAQIILLVLSRGSSIIYFGMSL